VLVGFLVVAVFRDHVLTLTRLFGGM
jgi:hypothetical protein